jgi:hypothetical protein
MTRAKKQNTRAKKAEYSFIHRLIYVAKTKKI